MTTGYIRSTLRLCLLLGTVLIAAGCGGSKRLQEHTELKGTVRYKGEVLKGGTISFFGKAGEAGITAQIHEDGTYSIKAPVGECKISVDNSMLKAGSQGKERRKEQGMGAGPRPGQGEQLKVTGTYMPIPEKYKDPEKSGLTYTVKKGESTKDFDLTD
jgi:hypothetical protein